MELRFNSIDEIKEFMKQLKGTRGGKGSDAETNEAPAPVQPAQQQQFNPTQFNSGGSAGFAGPGAAAGFPGGSPVAGAAQQGPSLLAQQLVQRINARVDGALQSGQPHETVLNWFREQIVKYGVAEASTATMDQIKQVHMFKLPENALGEIAKLMNA